MEDALEEQLQGPGLGTRNGRTRTSKVQTLREVVGLAALKGAGTGSRASKQQSERFQELKLKANRFKPWIEMKFQHQTPACRSLHACSTYNGHFFVYGGVYGGTDLAQDQSCAQDLWVLQPLKLQKPVWHKLTIRDPHFIMPDDIKRHQMVVRDCDD